MLRLLGNTSPQRIDFSRRFGNLQLPSSVIEGNWRLPKRLEKSISLWASVSKQPKQAFLCEAQLANLRMDHSCPY